MHIRAVLHVSLSSRTRRDSISQCPPGTRASCSRDLLPRVTILDVLHCGKWLVERQAQAATSEGDPVCSTELRRHAFHHRPRHGRQQVLPHRRRLLRRLRGAGQCQQVLTLPPFPPFACVRGPGLHKLLMFTPMPVAACCCSVLHVQQLLMLRKSEISETPFDGRPTSDRTSAARMRRLAPLPLWQPLATAS